MKHTKKHQPKFEVGDKVKNVWNENVYTVTSVMDGGYMLDDRYLPFKDEMYWELAEKTESRPEPTRKFNIGDIVQRGCVQYRITGFDGDDYVAIDTVKLEHGLRSQSDITKIGIYDDECKLVKKAESDVQQIEPKFKLGVDLSVGNDVDNIWRNTLADLVGGVTQRNTDAFVWLIDETLRFMDCGAYEESAVNGMRIFAKELKKRLGV